MSTSVADLELKKSCKFCVACPNNSRENPELSFFRIPKDDARCTIWKAILKVDKLNNFTAEECYSRFRICSKHFGNNMFSSLRKDRLKKEAIPISSVEGILPIEEETSVVDESDLSRMSESAVGTSRSTQTSEDIDVINAPLFDIHNTRMTDRPASALAGSPRRIISSPVPGTSSTMDYEYKHMELQDSDFSDAYIQTSTSLSANTPRKLRLQNKIRVLQRQLQSTSNQSTTSNRQESDEMKVALNFIRKKCSPALATFMETQLLLSSKSGKGCRYNNEFKLLALTMYFLGPKVYNFLKKIFQLPSKSTLCKITSKWPISTGFNDFVFAALETKVKMLSEEDRYCTLCIDEMSLKTNLFYNISKDEIVGFHDGCQKQYIPATEVLVLMARSINQKWKQQLGYFFVNSVCSVEDLQTIVAEFVRRLKKIGLNVIVVISDDGGNFHKFARVSGITPDHPYFSVDSDDIFYMVDVPHLVKSTRNNFFKHKLQISGNVTSKKYLEQFYESDLQQKFRLAPKLTNDHIHPNNFKKMKVKLATQVFSSTVAAAMNSHISFGSMSAQAVHTVDFIERMDKLFDIFNSSRNKGVKEYNKPLIGNEKQMAFLQEINLLFKNMRVMDNNGVDVTNRMKFIKGWQISISALLGLWTVLKDKGIRKLCTRRLNQDCLENFFGKIRQLSGNCRNPTCIQFQRSFKKLFALNFFEQSKGTNCIEDFDDILTTINPETMKAYEVLVPNTVNHYLFIDTNDYTNLELPEQNAFTYITGYFIKKCLEKHKCDICIKYAKDNDLLGADTLYTQFRAYQNASNDTFGNLQTPNKNFCDYLDVLENIFSENFPKVSIGTTVGSSIKNELKVVPFSHPCVLFPLEYLLSLYVRVRIYYSIKFINRNFKTTSKTRKENQKVQNLQHL